MVFAEQWTETWDTYQVWKRVNWSEERIDRHRPDFIGLFLENRRSRIL